MKLNQETKTIAAGGSVANDAWFDLRFKRVLRWSRREKLFRLFRVMWQRGLGLGRGAPKNYSAKLSFAIAFKLADFWIGAFWKGGRDERWLWICLIPCVPLRIHYQRSYGGKYV